MHRTDNARRIFVIGLNMGDKQNIVPSWKEIREAKKADLKAVMDKDPAATSEWSVRLTYAGYKALSAYRLAHRLYLKGHPTLAKLVANNARRRTGVEIHPAAKSAKAFSSTTAAALSSAKPRKSATGACFIRALRSAARARIRANATPPSKTT